MPELYLVVLTEDLKKHLMMVTTLIDMIRGVVTVENVFLYKLRTGTSVLPLVFTPFVKSPVSAGIVIGPSSFSLSITFLTRS